MPLLVRKFKVALFKRSYHIDLAASALKGATHSAPHIVVTLSSPEISSSQMIRRQVILVNDQFILQRSFNVRTCVTTTCSPEVGHTLQAYFSGILRAIQPLPASPVLCVKFYDLLLAGCAPLKLSARRFALYSCCAAWRDSYSMLLSGYVYSTSSPTPFQVSSGPK